MSKEDRLAYEDYMYHKVAALGDFTTAIMDGRIAERKIQEERIKQIENKHNKQLQEKDSVIQEKDSVIQEKDNKLQQLAQLLLKNGMTKEQIFAQTGIKL